MLRRPDPDKLDCFTKVVTPENIQFEYALAGPFQRLPAYIVDVVIWNSVFFGVFFSVTVMVNMIGFVGLEGIFVFLVFVAYFLVSWFYGIFFEAFFNGRTPGKMLFKLRAISADGRPINGLQAGLRNFLRVADLNVLLSIQILYADGPPYYLFPTMIVGLTSMILTSRMQRIGDLAAGTMVISEQPRYSPWNLQPDDTRAYGLAELIPPTYEVSSSMAQAIGLYMENRQRLGVARREEIAAKIAGPMIKKFELHPSTGNDLLLCALYTRVFLSEKQQQEGLEKMRRSQPGSIGSPMGLPPVNIPGWGGGWPNSPTPNQPPKSDSNSSTVHHSEF
jgi:uncharacterized RDD family membrane protein YckC